MLAFHLDENIDVSSRRLGFINRSVEWIAAHFSIGAETRIADFGCGPGLYAERLAQRHATVTGVDFSKRSIEYAQEVAARQGLNIHYVNQDYLEFETTDSFDLILMIMCDFCALSPTQRKAMLPRGASTARRARAAWRCAHRRPLPGDRAWLNRRRRRRRRRRSGRRRR